MEPFTLISDQFQKNQTFSASSESNLVYKCGLNYKQNDPSILPEHQIIETYFRKEKYKKGLKIEQLLNKLINLNQQLLQKDKTILKQSSYIQQLQNQIQILSFKISQKWYQQHQNNIAIQDPIYQLKNIDKRVVTCFSIITNIQKITKQTKCYRYINQIQKKQSSRTILPFSRFRDETYRRYQNIQNKGFSNLPSFHTTETAKTPNSKFIDQDQMLKTSKFQYIQTPPRSVLMHSPARTIMTDQSQDTAQFLQRALFSHHQLKQQLTTLRQHCQNQIKSIHQFYQQKIKLLQVQLKNERQQDEQNQHKE